MKPHPSIVDIPELEEVRQQFAEWRKTRVGKGRIPRALLDRAISMARKHGIGPVVLALGLHYGRLKWCVDNSSVETGLHPSRQEAGPLFVEVGDAGFGARHDTTRTCTIAYEKPSGAKMTVTMHTAGNTVERFVCAFWGQP